MTVEIVVQLMLDARTSSECALAWQTAHAWIRDHPQDEPLIIAAGNRLAVLQAAFHVVERAKRFAPEFQDNDQPTV